MQQVRIEILLWKMMIRNSNELKERYYGFDTLRNIVGSTEKINTLPLNSDRIVQNRQQ